MEPIAEILETVTVAKAQLGDQEAFEQLVRRYHSRVYYYVRKLLMKSDLADDVMQEVWEIAYRTLPKLRIGQAFSVWLYRIAYTRAIETIRTESRYVELPQEWDSSYDGRSGEQEYSDEEIQLLHAAIDLLSRPLKEVIVLRFLENMSYESISQITKVPVGTVKSRIYFAKQQLRKELEDMRK